MPDSQGSRPRNSERALSQTLYLAGERACPPEDVGGIWGHEEFLDAIRDPDHPEHEDYTEWIGGEAELVAGAGGAGVRACPGPPTWCMRAVGTR